MSKTYAGARLRRLREERRTEPGRTSPGTRHLPSYLNQMEHDSRPLTVPVLLRLTEAFGVDPGFFSERDTTRLLAGLREALAGEIAEARLSAADLGTSPPGCPPCQVLLDLGRRNQELAERLAGAGGDGATIGPRPRARGDPGLLLPPPELPPRHRPRRRAPRPAIGVRPGEVIRALTARLADAMVSVSPRDPGDAVHHYDPQPAPFTCPRGCAPASRPSAWPPSSPAGVRRRPGPAGRGGLRPRSTGRTRWPASASPTTSPPR